MTNDNEVARGEDQVAKEKGAMHQIGGKGQTPASAADTPGAFGDAERPDGEYDNVQETLIKGAERVGGELPSTRKQP